MRGLWVSALALALATPVAAHDVPAWRPVDAETGQIADLDGLEQLAEDFPNSGSVRLRLLNAQLEAGDKSAVLASLEWLKERGYVFSAGAQAQIRQILGEDYVLAADELLIREAEVIEASEVVAIVPAEAGLVESVYSALNSEFLIVTSVTGKALHLRGPEGEWLTVPIPDANDLSGIVSAADGKVGWIASANLDGSQDDVPLFTGLIGITDDFNEPKLVSAPEGVAVSDLSIGADGTVFSSDPNVGGVYRVAPGATTLERVIAPGTFRSPQGSAVSADGERLYISDYRYGLAFVDLASAKVSRLASDMPVILDGVDGLWLHKGELIAVQNGTSPMRISAFKLSDDGTRIVSARVLEQAHSGWTEPLGGSIADDALIYVATGQWDRYEKGKLKQGMEAIPTEIRKLPLGD